VVSRGWHADTFWCGAFPFPDRTCARHESVVRVLQYVAVCCSVLQCNACAEPFGAAQRSHKTKMEKLT